MSTPTPLHPHSSSSSSPRYYFSFPSIQLSDGMGSVFSWRNWIAFFQIGLSAEERKNAVFFRGFQIGDGIRKFVKNRSFILYTTNRYQIPGQTHHKSRCFKASVYFEFVGGFSPHIRSPLPLLSLFQFQANSSREPQLLFVSSSYLDSL